MNRAQIELYKQQFEVEMAAMSVSECRRWNPHLSDDEAAIRISQARAVVAKFGGAHRAQQALF